MIAAPTEIERIGSTQIKVVWQGGHESVFSNNFLRSVCPCATCNDYRSKRAASRSLHVLPESAATEVFAQSLSLVGAYAIKIQWSDGHDTGIYTWDFLREHCPCNGCREQRA